MKPTSLSPEFYTNLYDEICKMEFNPESEDDCSTYIELEDFEGYYVCLKVTFDVQVIDDSFDHAFGTEYGYHLEAGELQDIEEVTLYDEDDNDCSDLFDYDKFFEQFKKYEVKMLFSGKVIKSGDTILAGGRYNCHWDEMKFLYYDVLDQRYVCVPVGQDDRTINRRRYPKVKVA